MKLRNTRVRAAKFNLAERRRTLSCIDAVIAEFRRSAQELEQEIDSERMRASVRNPNHFVHQLIATAAKKRWDNLQVSIGDLETKRKLVASEIATAQNELESLQIADDRGSDAHL